jgi:hypothetical protein
MDRLRVLAMDHYFDQDLQSLEAHPRMEVRRFPYQRLRGPAMRVLGNDVATGLHAYNHPELAAARARYAAWLKREVQRLYLERGFDVIVLPSDTFFYVRSLPDAAHSIGVPVVVVQKETTVSLATMADHSRVLHDQAPFIADFMTVCSDRQREFWVRAGAEGDRIEVTGQPRFDVYANPPPPGMTTPKRVLFLAYHLDAYVPGAGRGKGLLTWQPLRAATELALLDSARRGACSVIVKCHPQQPYRAEIARYAQLAGSTWGRGFAVADMDTDTRDLIVAADVVVGFQTTALYEAVAARRTVLYAAWGEEYERLRWGLIPFHEAPPECLKHVSSAQELASALGADTDPGRPSCSAWYEGALGVVDGSATERVVRCLEEVVAQSPTAPARPGLERDRRRFATRLLVRSIAMETAWMLARPAARITGNQARVDIRRRRAREARTLAMATLRGVSRGEG